MFSRKNLAITILVVSMLPSATFAEGLLGGVLSGGSDGSGSSILGVVGSPDSGALVTLGSGNAGSSGLVNLGIGGSDGLVTTNIGGGSKPLVDAAVLGSKGIVDVNANLGTLGASVNVGGPSGLLNVGIGGGGGGNGGNGGNGGGGSNGGNGGNGGGGGNGGSNAGGNTTLFFSGSGSTGGGGTAAVPACASSNADQLVSLFRNTSLSNWNRASSIQLIPVRVCAELRRQVANWLAANGDYHRLVTQVSSDALINAALGRTKYQAGHVLGVQRQGGTLMVYVF